MAFSQQVTFPSGASNFPAAGSVALPANFQGAQITLSADGWPNGSYTVEILFSFDGGVSFPVDISATFVSPFNFPPGKSHLCVIQYRVGADQPKPTHTKARVTAPASFTSLVTITEV